MMEAVYPDIPRIYTAIAEWLACLIYLSLLQKRIQGRKLAGISVMFLLAQCALLHVTRNVPLLLWLPCMLAAAGLMYVFLYRCCRVSMRSAGYCCARAFLLAELAASLEWQIHCFFVFKIGFDAWWFELLILPAVYGAVFSIGWMVEKKLLSVEALSDISRRELWSAAAIVSAAFAFSNLSFIYAGTPFSSSFIADIYNIRTLVDLGGLAILYAYQSRLSELYAERELNAINSMLKSQYEHYRYYQESAEMVHIKYHDLKHQIAGLRGETDPQKRSEWLDIMEKELNQYEMTCKTGNHVLDTMLSIKQIYCRKHDINLTCVADGTILNFVHVVDLCTIFGNALDNAIESVITLEEPEQRLIHLTVTQQKNFVFIMVENYCPNPVEWGEELPITTKADKKYHGFGVKSMKYSAEKYGGYLSAGVRDHWFVLKILIPYPDHK